MTGTYCIDSYKSNYHAITTTTLNELSDNENQNTFNTVINKFFSQCKVNHNHNLCLLWFLYIICVYVSSILVYPELTFGAGTAPRSEHLSSPLVFGSDRVARPSVLSVVLCEPLFVLLPFFIFICPTSIHDFWLSHWYIIQTFLTFCFIYASL